MTDKPESLVTVYVRPNAAFEYSFYTESGSVGVVRRKPITEVEYEQYKAKALEAKAILAERYNA